MQMKRLLTIFTVVLASISMLSCNQDVHPDPGFKDMIRESIYDYVAERPDSFSMFLQVLEAGDLDATMAAYNSNGNFYTIFLPSNDAMNLFIEESNRYSTFDELLADTEYSYAMARYHVVNMGIITNDFPFGALPEMNLMKQYLTIGFEMTDDTSFYKINNDAPLERGNIEVSNGYVHVISKALTPTTFSSYQWIEDNDDYSIFAEAVRQTEFQDVLNRVIDYEDVSENPVTLLVEADSVYHRNNIFSFSDLADSISPNSSIYSNSGNNMYNYVGAHIMQGSYFLADFEETESNYSTYGNVPVNINGDKTIDLEINRSNRYAFFKGFDQNGDSIIHNYVTFYYDNSNVVTLSGSIHFVDQMLIPKAASAKNVSFQFFEEPLIYQYSQEEGEYINTDKELFQYITWSGSSEELLYTKTNEESTNAWDQDYLTIEGDFVIEYTLPKIVAGRYEVSLRAFENNQDNALVEVFIDGVKIGGLVDLTSSSVNSGDPSFQDRFLGEVNFVGYETHTVTIQTLIPGIFQWDVIIFNRWK